VIKNNFFQEGVNTGEISLYHLDTKKKTLFFYKANRKISNSGIQGAQSPLPRLMLANATGRQQRAAQLVPSTQCHYANCPEFSFLFAKLRLERAAKTLCLQKQNDLKTCKSQSNTCLFHVHINQLRLFVLLFYFFFLLLLIFLAVLLQGLLAVLLKAFLLKQAGSELVDRYWTREITWKKT